MKENSDPNCGKCGLCLTHCPVYGMLKQEQASPRARMQLIKAFENKRLASTPFLREIMARCLMCGACSAVCPSGIDHYSAFMKMRETMAGDHGEALAIRSLIYILARDYRTLIGTKVARAGQRLAPEFLIKNYRLGNIPLNRFPTLNARPFQKQAGERVPTDRSERKGVVAYFTGCATNYVYGDTGRATVGMLRHLGYDVILPAGQTCCSVPLLFHGAGGRARRNIETNIRVFRDLDVDAVIVDCSTCGEALALTYPKICAGDGLLAEWARELSGRVTDILTFTLERIDTVRFTDTGPGESPAEKTAVTYHAPCHSRHQFPVHRAAEALIEKIPGIIYRKAPDTETCCGGGGTFFYEFPEISKKMVEKKIQNAKSVKADQWLTDCPVCRMNLSGNLDPGEPLPVIHPITLIHAAVEHP